MQKLLIIEQYKNVSAVFLLSEGHICTYIFLFDLRTCGKKTRCRDCHEVYSEDCNPRGKPLTIILHVPKVIGILDLTICFKY